MHERKPVERLLMSCTKSIESLRLSSLYLHARGCRRGLAKRYGRSLPNGYRRRLGWGCWHIHGIKLIRTRWCAKLLKPIPEFRIFRCRL